MPSADGDFSAFANNVVTTVSADPATYGLTPEAIAELTEKVNAWDASYAEKVSQQESAKAATISKDQARYEAAEVIRALNKQIQGDRKVSDAKKADAGFPVYKSTKTPKPIPTKAPIAKIEACAVREHFLRFSDSIDPHSRMRPDGVTGVEIWVYCGAEVPVDDDQYQMYATSTRMNATVNFNADQAGKTAYYHFRFVNSRGQVGPWSMVYSSTVVK